MPGRSGGYCVVGGCSNKRSDGVSLHQFPKNQTVRDKWVRAIRNTGTEVSRANWQGPDPSKASNSQLVCSAHFRMEDFTSTTQMHWKEGLSCNPRLEPEAVPTLFGQQIDINKKSQDQMRAAFRKREVERILNEYEEKYSTGSAEAKGQSSETTQLAEEEQTDPVSDSCLPVMSGKKESAGTSEISVIVENHAAPTPRQIGNLTPLPQIQGGRYEGVVEPMKTRNRIVHKRTQTNIKSPTKKVPTCTKRTQTLRKHYVQMVPAAAQYCTSDFSQNAELGTLTLPDSCSTPVKTRPCTMQQQSPGLNSSLTSFSSDCPDDEEADPTYIYSPLEESDESEHEEEGDRQDPKAQRKFLVFEENLLSLFHQCPDCHLATTADVSQVIGTYIAIRQECTCGFQRRWESQPKIGNVPAGNLLISAAILFAGLSPTKLLRALGFINLVCISIDTFWAHQKNILWPAVENIWKKTQEQVWKAVRDRGGIVIAGGDGRADSPGHSAKYGAYTLMDLETGAILDIQLVQSNEVKSSYHMELEGLKRAINKMKEAQITVSELVTDRHQQIGKWIRENLQCRHSYDVWHIAKGLKKKLLAVAKEKECAVVGSWIKSITNHLYWSAASTTDYDGEMMVDKWKSVANHIQNVHTGHEGKFHSCQHDDLDDRDWLEPGTKACAKMEAVILSTRLCSDVKKMSVMYQTASLESLHSVMNHFAPKMCGFSYIGQRCRQYLAGLHFMENLNREKVTGSDGQVKISIIFPKYKKDNDFSVRILKKRQTFEYVQTLLTETVSICESAGKNVLCYITPPPLTASKRKPTKEEARLIITSRYRK